MNHKEAVSRGTRGSLMLLVIASIMLGCEPRLDNLKRKLPSCVFKEWKERSSYYALVEIVDQYIDPFNKKATKQDVKRYLGGEGMNSPQMHPNAGPQCWIYSSIRRVPYGSYLFITFDQDDNVKEIEWGSE